MLNVFINSQNSSKKSVSPRRSEEQKGQSRESCVSVECHKIDQPGSDVKRKYSVNNTHVSQGRDRDQAVCVLLYMLKCTYCSRPLEAYLVE
jgi:hypothetical protein